MNTTPDSRFDDPQQVIADLQHQLGERTAERDAAQRRLDERTAERDEALKQQTATAEVLQVINSSPGDLTPVFDAILEKAAQLCDANLGIFWRYSGGQFHAATVHGPAEFADFLSHNPQRPPPGSDLWRLLHGEDVVYQADHAESLSANPALNDAFVHLAGGRAGVIVALRNDSGVLGAIRIFRQDVRPFTDGQIALLQSFAAQAVTAMENARLLGELRTRTDELARREAELRGSEERYALVSRAVAEGIYDWDIAQNRLWVSARLIELFGWEAGEGIGERPSQEWNARVHPEDFASYRAALRAALKGETARLHCEYRIRLSNGEYRWVEDHALPVRDERGWAVRLVGAVSDVTDRKQQEQELREALDRQTATAEVLQVINASPGDLTPVFDAMLDKATRLCEADIGWLLTYHEDTFRFAAGRTLPKPFEDYLGHMDQPRSNEANAALAAGLPFVHVVDMKDAVYDSGSPFRRAVVDLGDVRTGLAVSLRKDGKLLGTFNLARKEVRPFTDKQIALLQNFAAQAVIAMENARLLGELRESLEQQTATAEVLQIINSSPGDLAPVFDAVLDKATRLCDAARGQLAIYDGEFFRFVAAHGELAFVKEQLAQRPRPPAWGVTWPRIVGGERFVHIPDVVDTDLYRSGHESARRFVEAGGGRSLLTVSLRKDVALLGALTIYRQQVRPFSATEIALLENFAAQAVIAMENARLITETREALEQQTATAQVLQVINSSPGDLAPVFDAMLEKAMRLCGAAYGELRTYDGERFRLVATHGVPGAYLEYYTTHDTGVYAPGTGPERILAGERIVHVPDLVATEPYRRGDPDRHALVDLGGARAILLVPLLNDDAVGGYIMIYRPEPGAFSDKQIALLQNFAAQSVIAMENARLITETREALEQQTATAEVLGVINAHPRRSRAGLSGDPGQGAHALRRDARELVSLRRRIVSRRRDPRLSGRFGAAVTPRGRPLRHAPAAG